MYADSCMKLMGYVAQKGMLSGIGHMGKKQAVLPGKVDMISHSGRKTGHIEKKQAVLPGKVDLMSHSVRKTGHIEEK